MSDGSTQPIEEVSIGDQVLAADPISGEILAEPVTDLIVGIGMKELVTVGLGSGRSELNGAATATSGHPFWVAGSGWTTAGYLRLGDSLVNAAGDPLEVTSVHQTTRPAVAHNLTVAELHTYYIVIDESPVLVHNASCRSRVWEKISLGPKGRLFGNHTMGARKPGIVNNSPKGSGKRALGWSVKMEGERARQVFRFKNKAGVHKDIFHGRYLN